MLYEISKLNKVQVCIEHLHLCKQHHLECTNIATRDCKQLYVVFISRRLAQMQLILLIQNIVNTKQETT